MTTAINRVVSVDANGIASACSWCCSRVQLAQLDRDHPGKVSHGLCADCAKRMEP